MYTINGFWHGAATLSGRVDFSQALATYGRSFERCTDQQLRIEHVHPRHIRRLRTSETLSCEQQALLLGQPPYPANLAPLPFAPPVLFYVGNIELLAAPCIAIVGARRCTQRGIDMARSLAHGLTAANFVVVSGLAQGIDTAAHFARPNRTIAVLGQGMEQALRSQKRKHMERIVESGGLLLSEFPPWIPASRYTFPQRNRIISGLCEGTVVVEATMRSGSKITARQALEQGRELMVIPGHPKDKNSAGCNAMLMEGAALVRDADDVLRCLGREVLREEKNLPSCPDQVEIIAALRTGDTFDHIVQHTSLGQSQIAVALATLELSGWIQRLPGDRVAIVAAHKLA
jgi:DNA processing protein